MIHLLSRLAVLLLLSLLLTNPAMASGGPANHPYHQQGSSEDDKGQSGELNGDDSAASQPQEPAEPDSPGVSDRHKASENALKEVVLEPMEATYRARVTRGISLSGEATRSLTKRDDGRWDYRFDVDSFVADIRESAVLSYQDNRVTPHRYRYSLEGTFIRNRAERYDFDWERMIVRDREKKRDQDISEHPEIQDQLTAQLQLWVDLKAGKTRMDYLIVDNGGTYDYQFEVLGEETIDTENFGKVDTIKVWRIRDEDSSRSTHMWFAPQWNYLLVRLEQREKGGEDFDIYLQKADIPGQRIRP